MTQSSQLQAVAVYSDGSASPVYRHEFIIRDVDDDGLPDWWETEKFGSVGVQSATSNRDGDDLTDLEEFLAGTDPDSRDTFAANNITINEDGSTRVSWPAIENRFYRIMGSHDLKTWKYLTDEISGVDGNMDALIQPSENMPERFFKIEVGF